MNIALVDTVEEGFKKIKEYEDKTYSKFYVHSIRNKYFGQAELYSKKGNSFILWLDTLPYIFVNQTRLECKYGPDHHIKSKYKQKKEGESRSDHTQRTKRKKKVNCIGKVGCPAAITLKEIFTFPEYVIPRNNRYNRIKASKELRASLQKKEVMMAVKKFLLTFPANESEHANHPVGEAAKMYMPVDERIRQKIKELVADSITSTAEIKRHLHEYVTMQLFPETPDFPPKSSRKFYPTSQDIRNIVTLTLQKLPHSAKEQEKIQCMVDDHSIKYPDDFFFFRSRHETESNNSEENITKNMLLVYQSAKQKYLLQRYGNTLCLLDAMHRIIKYTVPLFFLCVKTNVNYQVVAIFITQDETTASITEAVNILKEVNPTWNPKYFIADFCIEEINAIETVFPETFVFLCDFYREQTWERWLKNSSNGVPEDQRDDVLKLLRTVANAESIAAFDKAMEILENSNFWKTNVEMQNWFKKEWLSVHKRWVWAFRKDEVELPINTNDGVEHKNRSLNYDYLSKKKQRPLSSMINLIITEFIPDSFKLYEELNIKYSSGCQEYSENIPEYLVNRPRPFIMHCLEQMALAKTIQPCDIIHIASSRISFKIRSQTKKNCFYRLDFGNDDVMPSCECNDWQRKKWLCKHFFAIFQYTNITWDYLSSKFRHSPYFNLDMSIKNAYANSTETEHSYDACNDVYDREDSTPTEGTYTKNNETESNAVTNEESEQSTRSLAIKGTKVREMLEEIHIMSYAINDPSVMDGLKNFLEPILKYVSTNTEKQKGLPQNRKVKPTNKRKRNKNTENIGPPLRKKNLAKNNPTSSHKKYNSINNVLIKTIFDVM